MNSRCDPNSTSPEGTGGDIAFDRRARDLFYRCLELEEAEIDALLAKECSGRRDLERAVRTLLRCDQEAASIPAAPVTEPWRGRKVGSYELVEQLGWGGMAQVYLGRRHDGEIEQEVAVKLLRNSFDDGEAALRFRRERQLLATLDHPNIVRLLDAGTTDAGVPYLIMERVKGAPIDVYSDSRRLTIEDRVRLVLQACEAVEHAHQRLVVHRDLKPTNLLVAESGELRLLDFGVAKLLGPMPWEADAPPTATDMQRLTPQYASPEQLEGQEVSTASDVYALGLVLYELLAGRAPFSWQGQSPKVLAAEHRARPFPPPSQGFAARSGGRPEDRDNEEPRRIAAVRRATPRGLERQLRGDLDTIVLQATRADPDHRYRTAASLAADLERWLADRPIAARRIGRIHRARKFVRRNRLAVAAAALLAVATLGFTASSLLQLRRINAQQRALRSEQAETEAVLGLLMEAFDAVDPEGPRDGSELTARQIVERLAERLGAGDLRTQPATRARLLVTVGGLLRRLGYYREAERFLAQANAELPRIEGGDRATAQRIELETARVQVELGSYQEAAAIAEELVAELRESGDAHGVTLSEALQTQAYAHHFIGDWQRADDLLAEALTRAGEASEARRVTLLNDRAMALDSLGHPTEAEALYREAIEVTERGVGGGRAFLPSQLTNLGELLIRQGREDEAKLYLHRALELGVEVYGDDHPLVANFRNNLGLLLRNRGVAQRSERDLQEAERLFERAVEISRDGRGEAQLHTVVFLNNLGLVHSDRGRYEEAEALWQEAIDLARRMAPDNPEIAQWLGNLAQLRADISDFAQAERDFLEALRIASAGGQAATEAFLHSGYGRLLNLQGRRVAAERQLRRALEMRQSMYSDDDPRIAHTRLALADVLSASGQGREAQELLDRVDAVYTPLLPGGHWRLALTDSIRGELLASRGAADAGDALERGLEGLEQAKGSQHPETRRARERVLRFRQAAGADDAG